MAVIQESLNLPDAMTRNERGAFLFDYDKMAAFATQYKQTYAQAAPFPHIAIDSFIDDLMVDELLKGMPRPDPSSQTRDNSSYVDEKGKLPAQIGKVGLRDEKNFTPFVRHFLWELNSPSFISFLEQLTGIPNLLPDPKMLGGGTHQTLSGGLLRVHADFNVHRMYELDRRINLILYLNKDWPEEYGGHLELWDKTVKNCVERILPIAKRCVIFSTGSDTWHGHPHPLTCPPDRCRQSIALYYYTHGRPEHEKHQRHKTLWPLLPGEEGAEQEDVTRQLPSEGVSMNKRGK
jgi:Rps23 Pro-64 3,4-dihydroxylase Tpa1-like proline 4-hydroxylase